MTAFATARLSLDRSALAPDGSDVRTLLRTAAGSLAHFELGAGKTSIAVAHRTVDEIWYVISGRGEMWRKQGEMEMTIPLEPGVCLSIPAQTHFQFRASGTESVSAIGFTLPPWPGDEEAVPVTGPWPPTAAEGVQGDRR